MIEVGNDSFGYDVCYTKGRCVLLGFRIENEGVERRLVYRLEAEEYVDSFCYSMLIDNDIEGLLPIITSGMNGIEDIRYDIRSMISLRTYLESSMSGRRLIELFLDIINVIGSVSEYLLDSSMLVFDMDNIFLNGNPFGVSMVCLPVVGHVITDDVNEAVRNLFRMVIISARFIVEQDNSYVTELLNALNCDQDFSIRGFTELLGRLRAGAGQPVDQGISVNDGHKSGRFIYFDNVKNTESNICDFKEYSDNRTGKENDKDGIYSKNIKYTNDKQINNDPENNSGNVIDFPYDHNENYSDNKVLTDTSENSSANKGIIFRFTNVIKSIFKNDHSFKTGKIHTTDSGKKNEVSITGNIDIDDWDNDYYDVDQKPAMVCESDESMETVLLKKSPKDDNIPYLTRVSTDEIIGIDKQILRIGKDERYADYRITDNAAISRAHAEISVKDGICFLIDQDSLNHTYINGKELPGHTPEELRSGDVLRFADEEFIFRC